MEDHSFDNEKRQPQSRQYWDSAQPDLSGGEVADERYVIIADLHPYVSSG